jgi:hypothetical protein
MLREILRKMSRDDSSLQLRSLEQVLQLGHSIAQQDSQERLHEQRQVQAQGHRRGRTPSPRRGGGSVGAAVQPASSNNSHNNSFSEHASDLESHGRTPSFRHVPAPAARNGHALATPVGTTASSSTPAFTGAAVTPRSGPNGSISRLAKVPGLTPDPSVKKVKKVRAAVVLPRFCV